MKKILLIFCLFCTQLSAQRKETPAIKNLKITILSTMMAQQGIGEWGFSALVEADSFRILFDAGGRERTVLENAKELGIDLSKVSVLILSHNHDDHTTGWLPIRNAYTPNNQQVLGVTHVGKGFFDTRIYQEGEEFKGRKMDSIEYVKRNGIFNMHYNFDEIFPGIYVTGPVERKYPEKNYPSGSKRKDSFGNIVADDIPEDMSLIIRTSKGLVMVSGCGHSGIINTIDYTRKNLPRENFYAAIGGFHLFNNTSEQIKWTAEQIKATRLRYFMGAHCTGIEPVYQIREIAGLKRGECIVGSVGDLFDLDKGFTIGPLTK